MSALEKPWPVHETLLALEAERNHNVEDPIYQGYRTPFPLSIGTIQGGDWASTVPGRVPLEGRLGLPPELEGVTFGSEVRLLVLEGGLPTVPLGPGEIRQAQATDESVAMDDLERAVRALTIIALRFCGCEDA